MNIISYSAARDSGFKTYYTGKRCPHGHLAEKRVRDKRCVECHKVDKARYKKSAAWKRQSNAHAKRYRSQDKNKVKITAKNLVVTALRNGSLKKRPCEKCGDVYRIHAHHDDYSKPLDVKWLCAKHHHARHKELGTMKGLNYEV